MIKSKAALYSLDKVINKASRLSSCKTDREWFYHYLNQFLDGHWFTFIVACAVLLYIRKSFKVQDTNPLLQHHKLVPNFFPLLLMMIMKFLFCDNKNENEMDDKAINMANTLKNCVRDSKALRENLKPLYKIIKRISVCISHKPIT